VIPESLSKSREIILNIFGMIDSMSDEVKAVGEKIRKDSETIYAKILRMIPNRARFTVKENIELTIIKYYSGIDYLRVKTIVFEKDSEVFLAGKYFKTGGKEVTIEEIGSMIMMKDYLKPEDDDAKTTLKIMSKVKQLLPESYRSVTTLTSVVKLPFKITTEETVTISVHDIIEYMDYIYNPRNIEDISLVLLNVEDESMIEFYTATVEIVYGRRYDIPKGMIEKLPEILKRTGESIAKIVIRAIEEEII